MRGSSRDTKVRLNEVAAAVHDRGSPQRRNCLMATKAEQNAQTRLGSGAEVPGPVRGVAWIVSFGPVGAGSDGYLVRVETNAQALASLGYQVKVLEISSRSERTTPWANVETYPTLASVIREQRILGPIDWLANFRGQLALV